MALLDYSTYDDIRAVLGVSNEELEDVTLALGVYSSNLVMELEDVDADLPSEYATVAALASNVRTEAQQRFYDVTRLFAVYAVAKQLGSSLPLFSPKDVSDGKASQSRFADSPYRETLKKVDAYYGRTREKLETTYAALSSSSTTATQRTLFSISSPASDPVIGS